MNRMTGAGGMDFAPSESLTDLGRLYGASALFNLIQGLIVADVSQS